MSTNIKRAAAKALADALSAAIPALTDRVLEHQADVDDVAQGAYPLLAILPGNFTFAPYQDEEVEDVGDSHQVVEVGDWEGSFELRLYAKSAVEREDLEQAIIEAFMARELGAGLLMVTTPRLTIGGRYTLVEAPVACELRSHSWHEEMVFAKKRFSFLQIGADIPCLVLRQDYTIDQLVLAFTNNWTATSPATIDVEVNADGSVTAL